MSPEWLTAIGTLGTFVVIAASAIAALMQLRHMRGSNQIIALNEVRETIESPAFQAAENFVVRELPPRFQDPAVREALTTPFFPPEYQPARTVANFFETFGALVKNGIIDQEIACDLWGGVATRAWEALAPLTANRRAIIGSAALWENFEYLTILSKRYAAQHPNGAFPKGMERLPLPEMWPETKAKVSDVS
ncbi:MAG TPA: DUF4760 domain-containing protein [Candidatus Rubrimentiphilum sp.]|nr:DUF4760 domain-containing protein [Candidatus Rubrimentiphilum sp.]